MLNIYKASAGSGKTYTLAYEYIKMLLGQRLPGRKGYVLNDPKYLGGAKLLTAPHERILAITFTNKATAEMKSRIIKELEALTVIPDADTQDSDYAPRLIKEYGCTRDELAATAARALKRLLDDYGRFNVSTIDAFFQTILRSFAREIDRQGDYRLEIDSDTALSEAMSMLLDEVNRPLATTGLADVATQDDVRNMRQWLMDRAQSRIGEATDFNPFDSSRRMYGGLIGYLSKAFTEAFSARQKEMEEYLDDPEKYKNFVAVLSQCSQALRAMALRIARDTLEKLDAKDINSNVIKFFQKFTPDSGFKVSGTKPTFIAKVAEGNPDNVIKKSALSRADYYFSVLAGAIEQLENGEALEKFVRELQRTISGVKALAFINRYIERYRRDNNLILINDTNTLLNSIISEEDAPFIFERVGVRLENFMIDEFQDTSGMQWHHLSPLLRNSLGFDHDSLIIGDVKQSIYRWRGADSELLDHKAEKEFQRQSKVIGSRPGENTNYRSSHTVVRFNNTLFQLLASCPDLSPDIVPPVAGYTGIAQDLPENTAHLTGRVCFSWEALPPEWEAEVTEALDVVEKDYPFAERIARNILRQIENGYAQRDIAILVRTGAQAVNIATYLQARYPQISLMSEEALKLASNAAVRKVITALELIAAGTPSLDPEVNLPVEDDLPDAARRKNARKLRMRRMTVDCFNYYVAHGLKVSDALTEALKQVHAAFPGGYAGVAETPTVPVPLDGPDHDLREVRRRAPASLAALVEAIIELKITPAERRENAQYLLALMDLVTEFSRDHNPIASAFLRYWKVRSDSFVIAPDARRDAVTISTIHKAKGLEWDCVHVPLCGSNLLTKPRELWFDTTGLAKYLEKQLGVDVGTPPPIMYLAPNDAFALPGNPLKEQYDENCLKSVSDNLNVAYVAFTRAVRELDIYEAPDKQGTLAAAIRSSFKSTEAAALAGKSDIYIDFTSHAVITDDSIYIGEPTKHEVPKPVKNSKKRRPDPLKPGGAVALPDIEVSFPDEYDSITRIADLIYQDETDDDPATGTESPRDIVDSPDETLSEAQQAAVRQGLGLHAILSRMVTEEDLDESLSFHRSYIPEDQLHQLGDTVKQFFKQAGHLEHSWFSPDNQRVLTEQPVYDPRHNQHTRIDRIVWLPDGSIHIVDYKFTSRHKPEHLTQIRRYATNLAAMGFKNITAYLWYPLLGTTIKA